MSKKIRPITMARSSSGPMLGGQLDKMLRNYTLEMLQPFHLPQLFRWMLARLEETPLDDAQIMLEALQAEVVKVQPRLKQAMLASMAKFQAELRVQRRRLEGKPDDPKLNRQVADSQAKIDKAIDESNLIASRSDEEPN